LPAYAAAPTRQFLIYSAFVVLLLINQDLIAPTDANHHD